MIKKILSFVCCFLLTMSIFVVPVNAKGKTINEMQKEIQESEKQYNDNKNKQNSLNNDIKISKSQIETNDKAIKKAEADMIATGEKIQKLDADIEKKNDEIVELMKLVQLADGDIAYLEYIFGANDMADFIHKVSVVEEITAYNDKLVDEMNKMVEESKKLQKELKQKQIDYQKQIENLNTKINTLAGQVTQISEIQVDVEEEIKDLKQTIQHYKNMGCSPDQSIESCSRNNLPYDTAFWRPIVTGYASSEWGYRYSPITGKYKLHDAIDFALNVKKDANIYASSSGKVAVINNRNSNSCGGNYVIIHHNIKGVEYTSYYFHMQKVYVSVGQIVTKETVLGLMGGAKFGGPGYTPWDGCSTGQHLHFGLAKGLKYSVSQISQTTFNPRTLVNVPAGKGTFKDRTSKY